MGFRTHDPKLGKVGAGVCKRSPIASLGKFYIAGKVGHGDRLASWASRLGRNCAKATAGLIAGPVRCASEAGVEFEENLSRKSDDLRRDSTNRSFSNIRPMPGTLSALWYGPDGSTEMAVWCSIDYRG
jgi:hypothetical protein